MKRMLFGVVFTAFAIVIFSPGAFAQDHGEVGVYGELFRWGQGGNTDLAGLGGRVSINATHLFTLEAELGTTLNKHSRRTSPTAQPQAQGLQPHNQTFVC